MHFFMVLWHFSFEKFGQFKKKQYLCTRFRLMKSRGRLAQLV